MTFEEYREIVFKKLREMLSPFPEEEVEEYINRIAFSGATDFIEKYKDK